MSPQEKENSIKIKSDKKVSKSPSQTAARHNHKVCDTNNACGE